MNRSVYNYNGYVDRDRSRSPNRGDSRDRGNGSRDRDNRLHRDYAPAGQGFAPPSGAGWPRSQQPHDPASNGHQPAHPAWTPPSGKPRPNGHLPQLKAYPPDRYSFHCQTCRIDKDLYICCYQLVQSVGYMLPVLYCSISCQQHDFTNAQRPHRAVCTANIPQQNQEIKIRLGEEQDRNNRITNENNALNSRIKNYQEELLEREKDIERLRESRKKMEVELDHEKANTKSALKEAKSNEIRKDSIDRMISQMKKRMEENDKMEKEIQERKKTIDNLKKFIQNEMELYQSHKSKSEKKIKDLENELKLYKEKLKKSQSLDTSGNGASSDQKEDENETVENS